MSDSDNVKSPPSTPILLPRIQEHDDDCAVSSDSDAWSVNSDRSLRSRLNSNASRGSGAKRASRRSTHDNYDDMGLIPMSSDSYFSHHREQIDEGIQQSPRRRQHRLSDGSTSSPRRQRSKSRQRRASNSSDVSQTAQIYKNLLILEEALRQQAAQQRKLSAKYSAFLMSMISLVILTGYVWFFMGEGSGEPDGPTDSDIPSIWRLLCQVICCIDTLTIVLYYLSGEYSRTITHPRKFLTTTNRGIRRLNVRLVKVKVKTSDQVLDLIKTVLLGPIVAVKACLVRITLMFPGHMSFLAGIRDWLIDFEARLKISSSQAGVRGVKLVLNPRVFSTGTREQWELYRNDFWNKETMRRRQILKKDSNRAK